MAELVDIRRVAIDPQNLTALVRIADDMPLMTSDDLEGTARVYRLLPHIVEHNCPAEHCETFRDAMGDTEMAHLLEHVANELLMQTELVDRTPEGRTWEDEDEDRCYYIELVCEDDVLVAAALSCGVWILDWAYSGGGEPEPDVKAIVAGLVKLVENVQDQGEDLVIDFGPEEYEDEAEDVEDDDEDEYEDVEVEDDDEAEDEYEDVEAEDEAGDVEVEAAGQQSAATAEASGSQPAAPEEPRPLWTPAPDVPTSAVRARRHAERRVPEVEDEIDQIMATIEVPIIDSSTYDEFE